MYHLTICLARILLQHLAQHNHMSCDKPSLGSQGTGVGEGVGRKVKLTPAQTQSMQALVLLLVLFACLMLLLLLLLFLKLGRVFLFYDGAYVGSCLCLGCLASQQATCFLRVDPQRQHTATLSKQVQIKFAVSPSHGVLTPGQPIQTLQRQAPVRVTTKILLGH